MESEGALASTVGSYAGVSAEQLATRAVGGGVALGLRQLLVQGLNLVGMVALARLLSPADFGWYAIAMFILAVLTSFGDVGLGASLIRQRRDPTTVERRSVFTVQLGLAIGAAIVLFAAAPIIASAYGDPGTAVFFRVVAVALPLVAVQTMPTIQMERSLDFRRVAVVEVAQAAAFNSTALGLALVGAGIMSIAAAIVVEALVGAVLANRLCPWPWGIALDVDRVRSHLGFGIPYQASAVASLAKWSITPVFVGLWLGPTDVGYIYWAQTVATYAVVGLMILQRLYLPLFARLQDQSAELSRVADVVVFGANAVVAPTAILMLVYITPLTSLVYGDKWLPAVPLFFGLWTANLLSATATPLFALLNALGHSKQTFAFTALWMVATWMLGVPLIYVYGVMGYVYAVAIVQITNLLLFSVARRYVSLHLVKNSVPPWIVAAVMGVVMGAAASVARPTGLVAIVAQGAAGLLLYSLILITGYRSTVSAVIGRLRTAPQRMA